MPTITLTPLEIEQIKNRMLAEKCAVLEAERALFRAKDDQRRLFDDLAKKYNFAADAKFTFDEKTGTLELLE